MVEEIDVLDRLSDGLEEQLEGFDHGDERPLEPWQIAGDGELDRAIRRYKRLLSEKERLKKGAQKRIDEIQLWLEEETGKVERRIAFLEVCFSDYLDRIRESNPSVKSYPVPNGTIAYHKDTAKWRWPKEKDEGSGYHGFIECISGLGMVRIDPAPECNAIKNAVKEGVLNLVPIENTEDYMVYVTETGEVVPGLIVNIPKRPKIVVK